MREPYQRYLRLLRFNHVPSGREGLRQLVRRQLIQVPFENVSKLLLIERERKGRIATLSEYLDGIEHLDLGGTCYTANPFFTELLREVGYDADLLGCDMSQANVHTAIRVRLSGEQFHIDVGYGGPFFEPLPLASLPQEMKQGAFRYVLDRSSDGRFALSVFDRGGWVHGYAVNETPRNLDFFRDIILDSFQPSATFMTLLRVVRHFEDRSVELKNNVITVDLTSQSEQSRLGSVKQLREVFNQEFLMPRCPVEQAVKSLERLTGQPFFQMGEGDLYG